MGTRQSVAMLSTQFRIRIENKRSYTTSHQMMISVSKIMDGKLHIGRSTPSIWIIAIWVTLISECDTFFSKMTFKFRWHASAHWPALNYYCASMNDEKKRFNQEKYVVNGLVSAAWTPIACECTLSFIRLRELRFYYQLKSDFKDAYLKPIRRFLFPVNFPCVGATRIRKPEHVWNVQTSSTLEVHSGI